MVPCTPSQIPAFDRTKASAKFEVELRPTVYEEMHLEKSTLFHI